jgi:DMSO/TMAO reductase YedYZ molybdopterin-dependent catalytic subunit
MLVDRLRSLSTDPAAGLRQGRYASPLRDERVAAWLGSALGTLFAICFVTGLYSHVQQHPLSWLPVPARPAGLYRVTQGLHVAAGIASMPVLIAKLWVVWPRLVSWPPFRALADVVERLGLLALVGGGVFMVFSGISNIAQWYPWHFSFTASHYWVAWITIGAIVAHLGAKWSITSSTLRRGRTITEADPAIGASAEGVHAGLTRRGFLGTVAAASAAITTVTIGETLPGLAPLALLAPRDPRDRPVNKSAANAGVLTSARAADYRLIVEGRGISMRAFDLASVEAMPLSHSTLPIACVEGWSYSARWSGVRLRDLLDIVGAPPHSSVRVESLEAGGPYRTAYVNRFQARDAATLLAYRLDGERLSLDHGYPLRLIAPNRAGVLQTKWVTRVVVL